MSVHFIALHNPCAYIDIPSNDVYAMSQLVRLIHPQNPIALRKAKIVCNFGLSECNSIEDNFEINFL